MSKHSDSEKHVDATGGKGANSAHPYTDRASAAAHEAVDRLSEKSARAEESVHHVADDMKRRTSEAKRQAHDLREGATGSVRSYVQDHTLASLAIAFGAGVFLSAITRR